MSEKPRLDKPQEAADEVTDALEKQYGSVGIGAVSAAAAYCKPATKPAKRRQ